MDRARLLDTINRLGEIGANEGGGVDRVCLTPKFVEAARFTVGLMEEAGLEAHVDEVGNIVGVWNGGSDLAPVVAGSHIDTVVNAGRLDGAYGVLGAVEAIRTIREKGLEVSRPLVAAAFMNEEGVRYRAMTGSRYFAGLLRAEDALPLVDGEGVSFREAMKAMHQVGKGGGPAMKAPQAFVELHIEQGPILESRKINIGVVDNIVGIRQFDVRLEGAADHAGTTPMDRRSDALVAASKLVLKVSELAAAAGGVGTVGFLENRPNAPNVVPGTVRLTVDLRHGSGAELGRLAEEVRRAAEKTSAASGCGLEIMPRLTLEPTKMDEGVKRVVESSSSDLGLSHEAINSGAGHDTVNLAKVTAVGMVFVPSVGGKSHTPAERSKNADLVNGANVLATTLFRLAS
ncbi:MAG TPA: M20 family metallo-hydrolase [Nitrososphaerales archaeon]|nr:M20 family metallo-hydrolase [Nitrososphaerales archaeon]